MEETPASVSLQTLFLAPWHPSGLLSFALEKRLETTLPKMYVHPLC